jgi:hypothetical protein
MRASPLSGLLLAACASPPEPPPAQPDAVAAAPPRQHIVASRDPRGCAGDGRQLRVTEHGIIDGSVDPSAPPLTRARGRLLRFAVDRLYFFDTTRPILRSIGVDFTGRADANDATHVLELAPLEHPGFASPDPLAYLQRQEDLSLVDGVLCMDLHDRPESPTLTYNLRVDLAAATVERRLVEDLTGDRCGVEREAVGPRLCTPAGPSADASRDGTCVAVEHDPLPLAPTP